MWSNFSLTYFEYIKDFLNFIKLFFTREIKEGPALNKFEEKFADLYSSKYSLAAGSCRDVFYLIVTALNIKSGDEVILPAYNMSIFPKILKKPGDMKLKI